MSAISLETAKGQLNMWIEAEKTIANGQSYSIGGRSFTRANLGQVKDQIKFWKNEVNSLELIARRGSKRRVINVIPRDF